MQWPQGLGAGAEFFDQFGAEVLPSDFEVGEVGLDNMDFDDAVLDFLLRQGGNGEQVASVFILLRDAGGDAVNVSEGYLFVEEGRVEFGEFISGEDGVAAELDVFKDERKFFGPGWCGDGL